MTTVARQTDLAGLMERRASCMGWACRYLYDTSILFVKGQAIWFPDANANKFLDMHNYYSHVGHCICKSSTRTPTRSEHSVRTRITFMRTCVRLRRASYRENYPTSPLLRCSAERATTLAHQNSTLQQRLPLGTLWHPHGQALAFSCATG
jgi:hypothetical protein